MWLQVGCEINLYITIIGPLSKLVCLPNLVEYLCIHTQKKVCLQAIQFQVDNAVNSCDAIWENQPHVAKDNIAEIKKLFYFIYFLSSLTICNLEKTFGKSILQVPDTGTSQYWWILEYFWCTSIAWKCDIYVLKNVLVSFRSLQYWNVKVV